MSDQNTTEPTPVSYSTYADLAKIFEKMPWQWHHESGYRYGYHAGFLAGMKAAIATRPRNRVWDTCHMFWDTILFTWFKGDCATIVPPPTFQAPKRERGGAAKTKEPKA